MHRALLDGRLCLPSPKIAGGGLNEYQVAQAGAGKFCGASRRVYRPRSLVQMLGVFLMQTCPHCNIEICVRELRHQGLFKNYRICSNCGGSFTVDTDTKYRQAAFIVIAVISLVFTILLYYQDSKWLIPALVSYVVLGLLIYWGNKKVLFVPCQKRSKFKQ